MIEVVAQMVASVVGVDVAPGQWVAEGDTLLVVESMKMEIPVLAPVAGTVTELRVGTADIVVEGDVLAVIDPGPARRPEGIQARSALEMTGPQPRGAWAWLGEGGARGAAGGWGSRLSRMRREPIRSPTP